MDFHKEILNRRICISPEIDDYSAFRYFYNFMELVSNDEMVQMSAKCGFVVNFNPSGYRHRLRLDITTDDLASPAILKMILKDEVLLEKRVKDFRIMFWGYMAGCVTEHDVATTIAGAMDFMYVYKYKHSTEGIGNVH